MGGMDNNTSRSLTSAKHKSKEYHAKQNEALYKQYLASGAQYTCTFEDWKSPKKNKSNTKKQKPLTKKQLKERGYFDKLTTLNRSVRWK